MSEIPSDFISKKTFRSLPQLAFWTWLIVFIIDAVVLQRFSYSYTRVVIVWIIGLIVSYLFEFARYRNLNAVEKEGYGNRFLLVLNAFLIFMYASSYTGLTKQIGAWGEAQSTVSAERKSIGEAGILMEAVEWSIPVLAKQTSYFPDVIALAESKRLEKENKILRDSLSNKQPPDTILCNQIINSLNQRIDKLRNDSINCEKGNNVINNLNSQVTLEKQRYFELLNRVNDFNTRQAKWRALGNSKDNLPLVVKRDVNSFMAASDPHENDYYDFLFNTPINTVSNIKDVEAKK